jgi:hypothetical protein
VLSVAVTTVASDDESWDWNCGAQAAALTAVSISSAIIRFSSMSSSHSIKAGIILHPTPDANG